ncbi:acyl-CoA thioesterase [Pseudomonas sp. CFBP 8770]|uniref:acyl-CoA thioesterase n=1 Tax=unclassified Pseudomonas TaxID=196821 RepID=UPI00178495C2|nr:MULTISPECIES: thioesterase family protein [unclassified Pseudomonas]MBD8473193.1 acyl-CoA thioesterase [Pseudomonas sp. CFBP 8773]MBD8595921.1 acyl-CoA thioesterase [Pseudomonas sp. CFBP 8758]MBD8646320.1 acyl-CoA thioesterase [Pseudomonas sp. CFBP 8770]MBD8733540.1 acyl-CoA thioesterase [Pseudomonas sp. CFBP 13710]
MASNKFEKSHKIRFAECDPAGIVFYPQYFVMFNNLLEAWVDDLLPGVGFAGYIGKLKFGMPSVRIEADFKSVSKMGDQVVLTLEVLRLGSKSITLLLQCVSPDGEVRVSVTQVLVTTSLVTHKAIEVPDVIRQALVSSPIQE